MTVEIIIRGASGAQAARELLDFVRSFEVREVDTLPKEFMEEISRAASVVDKIAEAKIAENAASAKEETAKEEPVKKEPEKEESVATRRARKTAPKAAEPTAETPPAAPVVEATKPVEFTAPEGFNDNVKNDQAAPKELQDAALSKVKEFEPKDGEEVTLNYCRALLLYMAAKKGMDANRKMLEKFGVKKIAELSVERLKEFATAMKEESGV
jgi:hypothetical protein